MEGGAKRRARKRRGEGRGGEERGKGKEASSVDRDGGTGEMEQGAKPRLRRPVSNSLSHRSFRLEAARAEGGRLRYRTVTEYYTAAKRDWLQRHAEYGSLMDAAFSHTNQTEEEQG